MDSDIKYVNKDLSFLRKVFLSEDNIYKIVQGYKLKTGEQKAERKVYDNIEQFYTNFVANMKGYDGDIVNWVEKMNETFITTFYSGDITVIGKNKSKNGATYVRTDNFTMEDYKHYVPQREPINTTLNKRNQWYVHQNKQATIVNKITKPEFIGRMETGNFAPKKSPWSEAYMNVKSAAANKTYTQKGDKTTNNAINSAAYKPHSLYDDEEYNYTLF